MISIRELQPENDLEAVLDLCREFFYEYEAHHRDFFDIDILSDEDISGRFFKSVGSDTGVTLVALDDDTVVGYAAAEIRDQPPFYKIKKAGVVWGLMVAEEHRGRGIATRLLEEIKTWFARYDIRYFTLYTAVTNEAAGSTSVMA